MAKVTKEFDKAAYDKAYHEKHYWRLNLALPKHYKEIVKAEAENENLSTNAWIKSIIDEKLNINE